MCFEVVPNNMVSITLETDYKEYLDEVSYVIPDNFPCNYYEQYIPNLELFAVKSIHGYENMRDYIGFLKEADFEFKADFNLTRHLKLWIIPRACWHCSLFCAH